MQDRGGISSDHVALYPEELSDEAIAAIANAVPSDESIAADCYMSEEE